MQRYDEYKDSGVEWIGEIPEDWEVKKIKYIAKLQGGFAFKSELFHNDGIPIIRIGDIKTTIEFNDCKKVPDDLYIPKEFILKKYDTLIALSGATIGKTAFVEIEPPKAYINQRVAKVSFDSKLLFFNILSNSVQKIMFLIASEGAAQENISNSQIEDIYIALPSNKVEQKLIANYLNKKNTEIDELIAQKEQLLALYEEEKAAIINQAVTKGVNSDVKMKESGVPWLGKVPEHWEVKKFRFSFDLTKGLTITKANLKSNGIPCVNYGEIHSKYGFETIPERDELKYVDKNYLETSNQSLLKRGDFVFADTSEDIEGSGNFTHLHSDTNIFAGYHTIIARLKIDINYRYLAYFFDSIAFRNQVRQQVKGVKVYSITNAILKDTFIFLPSKQEQYKIVNFIENELSRIDIKIQKTRKVIALQKEYRTALISEVVTGKIKVPEEM